MVCPSSLYGKKQIKVVGKQETPMAPDIVSKKAMGFPMVFFGNLADYLE